MTNIEEGATMTSHARTFPPATARGDVWTEELLRLLELQLRVLLLEQRLLHLKTWEEAMLKVASPPGSAREALDPGGA
jgi:hypothetical protein